LRLRHAFREGLSVVLGARLSKQAFGKPLRALYLSDFFSNRPFRRESLRLLNHSEALHTLQRQIHAGSAPPMQGRTEHEQIGISGSLALLTTLS
jgi:TnpA family transposase